MTHIIVEELPNGLYEVWAQGWTPRVIRATTAQEAVAKFLEARK